MEIDPSNTPDEVMDLVIGERYKTMCGDGKVDRFSIITPTHHSNKHP